MISNVRAANEAFKLCKYYTLFVSTIVEKNVIHWYVGIFENDIINL